MSATIFDASASAPAPVSPRCWIGRSCYIFAVSKCNITVAVIRAPHSTAGGCVFVEFLFTKGILNTFDALLNSAPTTGHVYVINILGCKNAGTCLELLVEERGFKTKTSRGLPELQ
eukprot:6308390-Pyramimonas_sp.AAC.1